MAKGSDRDKSRETPALAGVSLADRSDLRRPGRLDPTDLDKEEEELRAIEKDSTIVPHGHKQLSKAFTSTARSADRELARHDHQAKQKAGKENLTELERLAAWGAQKVVVAGVTMTNAQAQVARQQFVDNEDVYAKRAVELGYIKEGEQEALKRGMRRKIDLEDRVGRGNSTEAERRESSDWDRSHLGRAGERATADIHLRQGIAADSKVQQQSRPEASKIDDVFQSAPAVRDSFASARVGESAAPSSSPSPVPTDRDVKRTGLDI